ncbi:uncharacterized protein BDR25DRAFT_311042 [Lindgomyces ingoldianus]|uniref:Uncharacterized protein n=1 Tax=Lindgomyces ingoldianus TaxID=673940 RepID=A0ACB6R8C4_9PLEO|nr:uncharacterized protein BDR25DRAFT_311042 [Lindgomyces ingoldianus]KAF2474575.1 hypothetical protein BDR25DRAFT_311042 [Lindgomyces ingoldianus]
METKSEHEHTHLPPSPPPSPPRRRHKKKASDPFFSLNSNISLTSPSPPSSPKGEPQEEQESLVTRIVISPILFTSFLLSLFLINRRDRVRRTTSYPKPSKSSTLSLPTYLSHFSPSAWIDPEPYQDLSSSAWDARDSTHIEPHSVLTNASPSIQLQTTNKRRSWHLNKKIRKVAKLEISDAFELRGRVILILVSAIVLVAVGLLLGLRWMVVRVVWGSV